MPREKFYNDNDPDAETRLEVSWQHGAYVQLTTALRRDVEASADVPAHVAYDTGAYVSLDRYGLNRLIQVLRRARNAAYGKDE